MLADTHGKQLRDKLDLADFGVSTEAKKEYSIIANPRGKSCVAYANSPGFETYSTGWHSLLVQEMPANA